MITEITTKTESILDAIKMAHLRMIGTTSGRGVLFIKRDKDWETLAKDKYVKENFLVYPVGLSKWHSHNITNRSAHDRIPTLIELMHLILLEERRTGKSLKPEAPCFPDERMRDDDTKPLIFFTGRGFDREELEISEELNQYIYN